VASGVHVTPSATWRPASAWYLAAVSDTPPPQSPLQPLDADVMASLAGAAATGDEAALERLLWHHHGRLLGFIRRKVGVDWQGKIEPEDVLQEAYVKIFLAVADFTYAGEDSFYRWATRILDHTFIDHVRHLRRAKRDATREVRAGSDSRHGVLLDEVLRESLTPSRLMRREDAVAAMMACIAKLPPDYREVVRRLHLDEESLDVVAAEMGRSEDAVRRLAGRAIEQLGRCLGHASAYLSLDH
jgi:RNA polymerase sigma-70 factor, ECF subfamily